MARRTCISCSGDFEAEGRFHVYCDACVGYLEHEFKARCWPEDASLENGAYLHMCARCGSDFLGHKRRVFCKNCHQI